MATNRTLERTLPLACRLRRGNAFWFAAFLGVAAILVHPAAVTAQQPAPLYSAGDAAVTGFSGALPPVQIAPGVDPDQKTFIDPNGPSLRVVDLHHMGGPAQAQLVGAPKPLTIPAALIGQVFGVALDDSSPPSIYAAASSVYGLPIVAPGPDGQPLHVKIGASNATFMPGLWGPQGGPGSIWKIDSTTGKVSLLANVALGGRSDSGAALGGLVYDPDSKSLLVADRETGLIYRYGLNGRQLGSYDHGVTGRSAQGLPPAPWSSSPGLNITSPQFDSTDPATWNYASPQRRVFGLAVFQQRLYYAVADGLQIWSVGLNADGSFGNDAVIELAVPPAAGPTEISKIIFDEQGRMVLAERPDPTGAFDFETLAVPAIGRVLRYALIDTTADGRRIWQQVPDDYAIGFPADFNNSNGGVAIGYNYDSQGDITPGSCGGFLWATGEDLRHPADAALSATLARSGALDVAGLQGNGSWLVRPANAPPLASYFIDYVDEYDDPAARGYMGDVAIERLCSPAQPTGPLPFRGLPPAFPTGGKPGGPPGTPPSPPACPPWKICGSHGTPVCPPGQIIRAATNSCEPSCQRPEVLINGKCCSVTSIAANAACSNSSCPSGQTAIGPSNFCCASSQVYSGANGAQACCNGKLVNGKCSTPTHNPPISNCAKGYVAIGSACCLASKVTSTGVCCLAGEAPSGPNKSQCEKIVLVPIGPQCCMSGIPTASGKCCAPANVTTSGVCCPGPVDPKNRKDCTTLIPLAVCAAGYTKMPDGSCCNNRFVGADGKSCSTSREACPAGEFRDANSACTPIPAAPCPSGEARNREGICVAVPVVGGCAPGEIRDRDGNCVPAPHSPVLPRIAVPPRPGPPPPRGPILHRPAGGGGRGGLFRR
jgi:hypothetical protein